MEKLTWGPWTCQRKMIERKKVSKEFYSQNHCKKVSRDSRRSMEDAGGKYLQRMDENISNTNYVDHILWMKKVSKFIY